jgi:hypothetical protein
MAGYVKPDMADKCPAMSGLSGTLVGDLRNFEKFRHECG